MLKSCSQCGRIHDKKNKCKKKIKIPKERTEEQKIRSKNKWAEKSKEMRKKANFLCEICLKKGLLVYDCLEVHHIIKIKEDKDKIYDDDNLIVVCRECHKKAEKGEIKKSFLNKIIKERGETTPPDYFFKK